MYLWPSSAQHNQISTTQRIGLILCVFANSVVLGLVSDHCVMFLLCVLSVCFGSLFPLCGYNFVVVRLVSVVLWRLLLFCALLCHRTDEMTYIIKILYHIFELSRILLWIQGDK